MNPFRWLFGRSSAEQAPEKHEPRYESLDEAHRKLRDLKGQKELYDKHAREVSLQIEETARVIKTIRTLAKSVIAKDERTGRLVEVIDVTRAKEKTYAWDTWPVREMDSGKLYIALVLELRPLSALEALGETID